jgi:hypothetical protein
LTAQMPSAIIPSASFEMLFVPRHRKSRELRASARSFFILEPFPEPGRTMNQEKKQ